MSVDVCVYRLLKNDILDTENTLATGAQAFFVVALGNVPAARAGLAFCFEDFRLELAAFTETECGYLQPLVDILTEEFLKQSLILIRAGQYDFRFQILTDELLLTRIFESL